MTNSPGGESGVEDPCDELRRVVVSARSTKTQPHSQTVALSAPTIWFSFKNLLLIFPDDTLDDSALLIFLPDLAPLVMTKGTDDVDNADEDGGVFKALSG